MTTGTMDETARDLLESIRSSKEAMSADRVFGHAVEVGGTTIIPVARLAGGAGGGAGEGKEEGQEGGGFGTGFGVGVQPMGVFEVRGGKAVWKPSVDVNRAIRGGQVLTAIIAICFTLVLLRRQRCTT